MSGFCYFQFNQNIYSVKKLLGSHAVNRLYTLCGSAMSTVSMSIVGAYMERLNQKKKKKEICSYSSRFKSLRGFIIASIINPYEIKLKMEYQSSRNQKTIFFEMLGEYILDGFKVGATFMCYVEIRFRWHYHINQQCIFRNLSGFLSKKS